MEMLKILLLEDDPAIRSSLRKLLGQEYEITEADTCAKAGELFEREHPDLCILDVNLGDGNGYEVCRQFRMFSVVPVLFVTVFGDEESVIRGLAAGGDDYISKPFSAGQLLARVHALLRRSTVYANMPNDRLKTGAYIYDRRQSVLMRGSQEVSLSYTELQILELLLANYGCLVARTQMFAKIWDKRGNFVEDNTLTVNISRLRKKLGSYDGVPYIRTVTGIGYRWEVPVVMI